MYSTYNKRISCKMKRSFRYEFRQIAANHFKFCFKESERMIRIQDIIKITKICSTNCGSSPYKCRFDLKKNFNGQFISMKHICLLCNPSIYLSLYHKDNKDLNWRRTNYYEENYFHIVNVQSKNKNLVI